MLYLENLNDAKGKQESGLECTPWASQFHVIKVIDYLMITYEEDYQKTISVIKSKVR